MNATEKALRQITEDEGLTGISVSLHHDITHRFTVFLHAKNGIRHGFGPDFESALASAKSDTP